MLDDAPRDGNWRSTRERLLAWLLLAVGVWIRVSYPDWIEFREDERYALSEAARALQDGGLARGLRGSHFNVMGPFFPLFFVPIVAWTTDPVVASLWVVLWNLLALAALLVLLRRAFGERFAVYTTALVASLPLAAIYARKVWQPDLIVPFTFPLFLAILALAERWRRSLWLAAVVLYALVCQVHPSAWFLAPGLIAFLWIQRVRPPAVDLALGVVIALALYASYLLYEARTGFDDLAFVFHHRPEVERSLSDAGRLFARNFLASIDVTAPRLEGVIGPGRAAIVERGLAGASARVSTTAFRILAGVATVGSIVSVAALLARRGLRGGWSRPERVRLLFGLLVATVVPGFVLAGIHAVPHYHIALYPCVAFFFVDGIARLTGGRVPWLLPTAVATLVVGNALLWSSMHSVSLATPRLEGGVFRPLDPESLARVRRTLPEAIDADMHMEERWRAAQALLEERFAASSRTLLALDVARNEPPLTIRSGGSMTPGPEGLQVLGAERLNLPVYAPDEGHAAILRLEMSVPQDGHLIVYRIEPGVETFRGARAIPAWIPRGRGVLHVELPPGGEGALMLVVRMHRWVLHACEVRAVDG